jgi:hypothetical protein
MLDPPNAATGDKESGSRFAAANNISQSDGINS